MSQTICILNSYDRILNLKINDIDNEYNQLKYYFNDNEDDTETVLIDDNKLIELERLNIGKYTLYAYSNRTLKSSKEIEVYIPGNNYQTRVDNLWTLAKIEENEYNNTLKRNILKELRHNPEFSLLYILCVTYQDIEDIEEFERELFFKLIITEEKYENLESSNYNRSDGFNVFKNGVVPKLSLINSANTIKVYKIISPTKKILKKIYKNIDTETELYFDEDSLYEIQILNDNDLIVSFKHFHFDYDNTLRLWESINDFLEEYEDITEDLLNVSSESKMTHDEIKKYLLEKSMFPKNIIVPRVRVSYLHYDRTVDLGIKNISYMNTSNHSFYLSGKDIDFIDEDTNNRFFAIDGNYNSYTTNFNPIPNMIDREALLYIVDENGTIVSKAVRALFTEDDYENYNEYYEKIRLLELENYRDNLIKYISNIYPQYYDVVQDTMYNLIENTDINIDNILENLINTIDNEYSSIDKNKLFYEILKNHFINSYYDSQFFSEKGFTWEPYTFKLITEESKDGYVLCILAKEQGEEKFERYYIHSFNDRAIELKLNRYGKYIIYAISEKDYKYSGFFYLNVTDNFYKSYLLNQGVR